MTTNQSIKTLNIISETKTKKTKAKSGENSGNCIVCNKNYEESNEDWFQCKVCSGWAHESCGIKGLLNFFCKKCF